MEMWKAIPGYEGLYEVSNQGRVRSVDQHVLHGRWGDSLALRRGRVLKQATESSGRQHKIVQLSKEGKRKNYFVHTLMLEAFVGPKPAGMECRHLNDVGSDNRLENLVWGTRSQNMFDRARNGMSLNSHNSSKTHCPQRHAYTPENTYTQPNGSRTCRICTRERCAAYRARKRCAQ